MQKRDAASDEELSEREEAEVEEEVGEFSDSGDEDSEEEGAVAEEEQEEEAQAEVRLAQIAAVRGGSCCPLPRRLQVSSASWPASTAAAPCFGPLLRRVMAMKGKVKRRKGLRLRQRTSLRRRPGHRCAVRGGKLGACPPQPRSLLFLSYKLLHIAQCSGSSCTAGGAGAAAFQPAEPALSADPSPAAQAPGAL
jgi:hypothetical protein